MSIKKRVRWFLIHLRRGDVEAASFERLAAYTVMVALFSGFLLLVGGSVRKAWADINHALSAVSPRR